MAPLEKRINIQEAKDAGPIERLSTTPLVDGADTFESAYITGLKNNQINILDPETKIIKNEDGTFSICAMSKRATSKFTEFVRIQNTAMLQEFIQDVIVKHHRDALDQLHQNISINLVTETNAETNESLTTLVIQEELVQLKNKIAFENIINGAKALTTGGTLTLNDGSKKYFTK